MSGEQPKPASGCFVVYSVICTIRERCLTRRLLSEEQEGVSKIIADGSGFAPVGKKIRVSTETWRKPGLAGFLGIVYLLLAAQVSAGVVAGGPPETLYVDWTKTSDRIAMSFDPNGGTLTVQVGGEGSAAGFMVQIDESPRFVKPLVDEKTISGRLRVGLLQAGLTPGTRYFIRVEPGSLEAIFRLRFQLPVKPPLNLAYLGQGWESTGRRYLSTYSGIGWHAESGRWELDAQWPHATARVGSQAYYLEPYLRGAVNLAAVTGDTRLMDELVLFLIEYQKRFTTLGSLRNLKSPQNSTELLDNQGPDSAVTLGWLEKSDGRVRVRECTLCNAQFYHPVSRLLRVIAALPDAELTQNMKRFVSLYTPIIVRDHLMRLVFQAVWNYYGAEELPPHLIDIWHTIATARPRLKLAYQTAMTDTDLWLIATAAEMLGAYIDNPNLIGLSMQEQQDLRRTVQVGVDLFRSKLTLYPDTRDFAGNKVGSASPFNGDYDGHPELAYAGYTKCEVPDPRVQRPAVGASWDISHFYRVPVFLRSLYDTRRVTESNYPSEDDVRLIINQLMYRVVYGPLDRPLFRNFFDGQDGWYRLNPVDESGYPPSACCIMRDDRRPCLTLAGIYGWGMLAFLGTDLMKLQRSLVALAFASDPRSVAFRDRYYYYANQTFAFFDNQGRLQFPPLLLNLIMPIWELVPLGGL